MLKIYVSFTYFICYCCINIFLVFHQKYKSSLKKQKYRSSRWQMFWKKVFWKSRPKPLKKQQLWRSYFLVKLQVRSLSIYIQINSSIGIFQGKSYLLYFRIPRTPSFQNVLQWLLLKIEYSLFQCSFTNVCLEHLF